MNTCHRCGCLLGLDQHIVPDVNGRPVHARCEQTAENDLTIALTLGFLLAPQRAKKYFASALANVMLADMGDVLDDMAREGLARAFREGRERRAEIERWEGEGGRCSE